MVQGFVGLRLGAWMSQKARIHAALAALLASSLACGGEDSTVVSDASDMSDVDMSATDAPSSDGVTSEGAAGGLEPTLVEGQPLQPSAGASPAGPPDSIFDREHLVEVRVEMAPEDWEVLSGEGIGLGEILFPANGFRSVPEYTHFPARVTVDGVTYEDVDIRKKGYIGSLSVIRPSLKLDFERRLGTELAAGNRRMTLNNDLQDPSHVKQCLSYDLFAEIGLPAPRCNFAHVVVNGVDLGIYTHVEAVNKPLLRRYFDDVDGNMYEGQLSDFNAATQQYLEMETNQEQNDGSDVQAVIDALALPDDQVVAALGALVDLEHFRDFWALETLLGHWDGYASNSNNYFAYHDPTSNKFYFIPWGTDQTFVGDNPNDTLPYLITVYATGTIANRLYAIPEQRALYRERLGELNDALWDVPSMLERVTVLSRLAPDSSREAVTRLRSYIRAHGDALRSALAEPAPEWPVAAPTPPGDACQGTSGELSATFSMQWGSLANVADVVANGSPDVQASLVLDGEPLTGAFRGRAGEDGFLPNATLRLIGQRTDGFYVLVDLAMPIELFEPGYHPLHSFESFGLVGLVDPVTGQFANLGLLGDGGVQLDEASLEPGGRVSGRLSAKASYFSCASTIIDLVTQSAAGPGEGPGVPADTDAPEAAPAEGDGAPTDEPEDAPEPDESSEADELEDPDESAEPEADGAEETD
jgi:hypothetical protein